MNEPRTVAVIPAVRRARMRLELTISERAQGLSVAAEYPSDGAALVALTRELESLVDAHGVLLTLEDRLRHRSEIPDA